MKDKNLDFLKNSLLYSLPNPYHIRNAETQDLIKHIASGENMDYKINLKSEIDLLNKLSISFTEEEIDINYFKGEIYEIFNKSPNKNSLLKELDKNNYKNYTFLMNVLIDKKDSNIIGIIYDYFINKINNKYIKLLPGFLYRISKEEILPFETIYHIHKDNILFKNEYNKFFKKNENLLYSQDLCVTNIKSKLCDI